MTRHKKKAVITKAFQAFLLFDKVFSIEGIVANIDGAFTPKNFAGNKRMVQLALDGYLLIYGVVFRNTDVASYRNSRFTKTIRITRIEWPESLSPTNDSDGIVIRNESKAKEELTMATGAEVMIQIFKENAKHLKNLYVSLRLDVEVSNEARKGGSLSKTATDFVEILAQCEGLQTLCIRESLYYLSQHARKDSMQVKLMEIMKKMSNLTALEWRGNMTEDAWQASEADEFPERWTIVDYLPCDLKYFLISDGDYAKLFPWTDEEEGFPAAVKGIMSNKRTTKLEELLLPRAFWGIPLGHFKTFIKHVNAGKLNLIGVGDKVKIKVGYDARIVALPAIMEWPMPPPVERLDLLVRSLTRGMVVDLGDCDDAEERAVRMHWAASLTEGEGGFYKCEREDNDYTWFNLWKNEGGVDFEVRVRVF